MGIFYTMTGSGLPVAFADMADGAARVTDRWREAGGNVCRDPELAALAGLACLYGHSLLTERDGFYGPGEVGLVVNSPSYNICPAEQAAKGRAHLAVVQLRSLDYLARSVNVHPEVIPGRYSVLIVGQRAATGWLIPPNRTEAAA